jgi:hypothetical protein
MSVRDRDLCEEERERWTEGSIHLGEIWVGPSKKIEI